MSEELKKLVDNLINIGFNEELIFTDKTDENTKLKELIIAYCKTDKVKIIKLNEELEKKVDEKRKENFLYTNKKTSIQNDKSLNSDSNIDENTNDKKVSEQDNNSLKGLQLKIAFLEKENSHLKNELKTYKEKYEKLKNFEKAQGKGRQLKQLKKTDEQIYILKYQTKLTYQEIADICDCSISTIKKRIATYKETKGLK